MSERVWPPAGEYLQNQAAGQVWPMGCSLSASALGMSLSPLDLGIFQHGPMAMR